MAEKVKKSLHPVIACALMVIMLCCAKWRAQGLDKGAKRAGAVSRCGAGKRAGPRGNRQ